MSQQSRDPELTSYTAWDTTPVVVKATATEVVLRRQPIFARILATCTILIGSFILYASEVNLDKLKWPQVWDDEEIRISLGMVIGGTSVLMLSPTRSWKFDKTSNKIQYNFDTVFGRFQENYSFQDIKEVRVEISEDDEISGYVLVLIWQDQDGTSHKKYLSDSFSPNLKEKQDTVRELCRILELPFS